MPNGVHRINRWIVSVLLSVLFCAAPAFGAHEAAIRAEAAKARASLAALYPAKTAQELDALAERMGRTNFFRRVFLTAVNNGDVATVKEALEIDPLLAVMEDATRRPALHLAAEQGSQPVVELLLAHHAPVNAATYDQNGFGGQITALHQAARAAHVEVIRTLLSTKADVNVANEVGYTPLMFLLHPSYSTAQRTVGYPPKFTREQQDQRILDAARLLVRAGAEALLPGPRTNYAVPLEQAARFGKLALVDTVLTNATRLAGRDGMGNTLLHHAVLAGRTNALRELLLKNLDPLATNSTGQTPFQIAAFLERQPFAIRLTMADLLLAKGAKLDLLSAAALGKAEALETFLKGNRVLAQTVDDQKRPALHWAVASGVPAAVEVMLRHGASPSSVDQKQQLALHEAVARGDEAMLGLLLSAGSPVNNGEVTGRTPLHIAAELGNIPIMESLFRSKASVNSRDKEGRTPLHLAASKGLEPAVRRLIAAGADVNARDVKTSSPLNLASQGNHSAVMNLLLENRAVIQSGGKFATTPLHSAIVAGDTNLVLLSLAKGVDINGRNADGKTALYLANERNRIDLMDLLLKAGVNINAGDSNGLTALHARVIGPQDQVPAPGSRGYSSREQTLPANMRLTINNPLLYLLEHKADPNARDLLGRTPLHWLPTLPPDYRGGSRTDLPTWVRRTTDLVALLKTFGANVNATDHEGRTPLHAAAERGDVPAAFALLENGAKLEARDKKGLTPLLAAADRCPAPGEMLLFLNANRADMVAQDKLGRTFWHMAALRKLDMGKVPDQLATNQAARAGINLRDKQGRTPLHVAPSAGWVHVLVAGGADANLQDRNGDTPLHVALRANNDAVAWELASKPSNLGIRNKAGETQLYLASITSRPRPPILPIGAKMGIVQAASTGDLTTVEILLKTEPRLARLNQYGSSPLKAAVLGGHERVVNLLLANGAPLDPDSAVGLGKVGDLVRALQADPALVAKPFTKRPSLLHVAVRTRQTNAAEVLLAFQPELHTATDIFGHTPLYLALTDGATGMAEWLMSKGANENIFDAVSLNHVDRLRDLLAADPLLVHRTNAVRRTPLYAAVEAGYREMTEILLQHGASPTLVNQTRSLEGPVYGSTYLHSAAGLNRVDLGLLLLAAGADKDAMDSSGFSPLHVAAARGHQEFAALLLDSKAAINARLIVTNAEPRIYFNRHAGHTPLHIAALLGKTNMVEFLLQRGANIHATNSHGVTPVMLAKYPSSSGPMDPGLMMNFPFTLSSNSPFAPHLPSRTLIFPNAETKQAVIALLVKHGAVEPMQPPPPNYPPFNRFGPPPGFR